MSLPDKPIVGRFAPSPTGPLHLGSLVAALGSYLFARASGGRWLMRMEDLDKPRVVKGCDKDILLTLERFGFEWDGEVLYQSRRTAAYEEALQRLLKRGLAYPCGCTRREIAKIASAPHTGEEGPTYPGTCRSGLPVGKEVRSFRFLVPEGPTSFTDLILGEETLNLQDQGGDFVIKRADGIFAYQLAVVVDDAERGVNQVVRGQDLISSTPRQLALINSLGYKAPTYAHLPLVTNPDGSKLSKRDNLISISLAKGVKADASDLLTKALAFLGQAPPADLKDSSVGDILRYGVKNFSPERIPSYGSALFLD